jgi:hypothetical protein
MIRGGLARCYAIIVLIACGQPAGPGDPNQRSLEKTEPIRLTRKEGDYEATLLFQERRGLLSFGIVSLQKTEAAPLPMASRAELWRPLLEQLFRAQGRRKDYLLAVGQYPELGGRIAAAATCSGKWNPNTGKPRAGNAGAEVKELLNTGNLTPEVASFVDSFGYRLSVSSTEQVMLCRWKEIQPGTTASCRPNLGPDSWVPCGASILFRMVANE